MKHPVPVRGPSGGVMGYLREAWDGACWTALNPAKLPIGRRIKRVDAEQLVVENARLGRSRWGTSFIEVKDA